MFESVTGKCRMVHLDVDLEILVKTMGFEESYDGFSIHIILVLGRFHRFGFDEERTGKPLGTGIVASHAQHGSQMLLLTFLVGVEQRHITFTTTPEHIVGTTQLYSSVNSILNLYGCACHYIEIGICSRAVHITLVAEHIGSTPQVLYTCLSLLLLYVSHHFLEIGFVFLNRVTLAHQIHIMEAEVFDTHFLHELKSGIHFVLGCLDGIGRYIPRERFRSTAELVATFGT